MIGRATLTIPRILVHEGGFVNNPHDPGGATNKGVTIGTLKRLHIDVDGDGDTDLVDLKALPTETVIKIYKLFYWDAVKADYLPAGLDYAMADFAVNSGPGRAGMTLQRILGTTPDGDIGPKTLAELQGTSTIALINGLQDRRLAFLRQLPTWPDFGRGWTRRVEEVRKDALSDAKLFAA